MTDPNTSDRTTQASTQSVAPMVVSGSIEKPEAKSKAPSSPPGPSCRKESKSKSVRTLSVCIGLPNSSWKSWIHISDRHGMQRDERDPHHSAGVHEAVALVGVRMRRGRRDSSTLRLRRRCGLSVRNTLTSVHVLVLGEAGRVDRCDGGGRGRALLQCLGGFGGRRSVGVVEVRVALLLRSGL